MMNEGMSKQNPENHTDPIWQMHMQTLMKRKRSMEIAQTLNEAINDYYEEQGKSVPNWKCEKNPEWWIDYLRDLGIDTRNP